MTNDSNLFSTRDITLAATLITIGIPMASIDYQVEGHRPQPVGYFKFEDNEALQEAQKSFWAGELLVEPRKLMTNIHGLKAQLSNIYKNPIMNMGQFKKVTIGVE